ncbi:hypothetical protein [Ramlibacter sp.]|uniref:hypothetical protein n=1 Tax=Ramlibacter sp. TaxID=1917967 RepID=UPI003D0DE730
MSFDLDAVLEGLKDSLAAAFPSPVKVTRDLIDPAQEGDEQLAHGVICLVAEGGGEFANYLGREGELGKADVALVVFLKVANDSTPADVESAELQWLKDLTAWCATGPFDPADDVLPGSFVLSKQLEHPYGWLLLKLAVDA